MRTGDAAAAARFEAAHDAIMMRQLTLRMRGEGPLGGVAVSKSVAYADAGSLLPSWAPRRADCPQLLPACIGALGASGADLGTSSTTMRATISMVS
jgi:hypothetical protein